jgi:hypothetical protein
MERTPTRVTASLIFNNLSSNGVDLVYAHSHEAVLVPDGAGPALGMPVTATLTRCKSAVTQVRFLQPPLSPTPMLAVLTYQQGLLYSPDGKRVLHSVALPTSLPPGSYLRGVAACTVGSASYVFFGTSGNGDLLRVNATLFGDATELPNLCSGAVSDFDSGEGGVLAAAAATNAVNGASEVVLMSLAPDGAPVVSARLPEAAPGLCTSLRVLGGSVFCGYSTGHIRVIDLKARSFTAVVTAHARWINALEVSAALQTGLRVWGTRAESKLYR